MRSAKGCIFLNCLSVYHLPLALSSAVVSIQSVKIGCQLQGFNVSVDLEVISVANFACMHKENKVTGI